MLGRYKYINYKEGRNPEDCFSCGWTDENPLPAENILIRDDRSNIFYLFESPDRLCDWLRKKNPSERTFHEIIPDGPQRIKFDIDASVTDLEAYQPEQSETLRNFLSSNPAYQGALLPSIAEKFEKIVSNIILQIRRNGQIHYGDDPQIIRFNSIAEDQSKFSVHLLLYNTVASNCAECAKFTEEVYFSLRAEDRRFLDVGVNKKLQSFRLPWCTKSGTERYKIPEDLDSELPDSVFYDHYLVRIYSEDVKTVRQFEEKAEKNVPLRGEDLHSTDVDDILEYLARPDRECSYSAHKLRETRGSLLLFTRVAPSWCSLCSREHHKDDTLMIGAHKRSDQSLILTEYCRRHITSGTEKKSIVIGEIVRDYIPPTPADHSRDGIKKIVWDDGGLRDFPQTRTLLVHAPMKMGKTKKLREYISAMPSESKIVIVSFRQTFTAAVSAIFTEFEVYSDSKGPLSGLRTIVQVESLDRLSIGIGTSPPDLLVLDECESIFEQLSSGLHRDSSLCFAKFEYLVKYSQKLIAMDACMSERTFSILGKLRDRFYSPETILHHCTFPREKDSKYLFSDSKYSWFAQMTAAMTDGKKIVIAATSLADAKVFHHHLSAEHPQKIIQIYSSETPSEVKLKAFRDVDSQWSKCDCLIYTPTVTAGVSFEKKYFDQMFCWFCNRTTTVETAIQMIGRIRNLRENKITIWIENIPTVRPLTIAGVKEELFSNRAAIYSGISETGLLLSFDHDGTPMHTETSYFHIWGTNAVCKNISAVHFRAKLISLLRGFGAMIEFLPRMNSDDAKDIYQEAKKACAGQTDGKIANAPDLSIEDHYAIVDKTAAGEDLTEIERSAVAKARLRQNYCWDGKITPGFVRRYDKPRTKKIYRALVAITSAETAEESLAEIKKKETTLHNSLMGDGLRGQIIDLSYQYHSANHQAALELLRIVGFSGPMDEKHIPGSVAVARITQAGEKIDNILSIVLPFVIRADLYPERLPRMNSFLGSQYGIKIRISAEEICKISRPKYFCFTKIEQGWKIVPRED